MPTARQLLQAILCQGQLTQRFAKFDTSENCSLDAMCIRSFVARGRATEETMEVTLGADSLAARFHVFTPMTGEGSRA